MNKYWFVVFVAFTTFGLSSKEDQENPTLLEDVKDLNIDTHFSDQPLHVDPQLLDLLKLSENQPKQASDILRTLDINNNTLNVSERFILLLIKANIHSGSGYLQKSINLLNQAIKIQENLPKKQVYLPEYAQVHTMLALIFVKQEKYQQAYQERYKFFKLYENYKNSLREEHILKFSSKYQTDLKVKENQLLLNQQEINQLKLEEVARKKNHQKTNLVVIVVAMLIFITLLFRQFSIQKILKREIKIDSLTGLLNRRMLFKLGEQSRIKSLNKNKPLSLLILDIDRFKQINDNYGYDVGDSVIKLVAQCGVETFRLKDVFSRIGGEEYAVILPNTELAQARAIAERYREKVQKLKVFDSNNQILPIKLSISIGIAQFNNNLSNFEELLHQADIAMYQAKEDGRNCVRN